MKIDRTYPIRYILATVASLGLFFNHNAAAQTVYSEDFSSPVVEWTDNTIASANGEFFLAGSANGSGFGANALILNGLPAHSSVTVSFDLYIIQSWDGNGPEGGGPDNFTVGAGGTILLYTNFANYTGLNTQAYPAELSPFGSGADNPPRTGQSDSNHLGYGTGDFGDATYSLTCTFAHSGSDFDIFFQSDQNQAVGDEGWGLDNVVVTVSNSAPPDGRPCIQSSSNPPPSVGGRPIPSLTPVAVIFLVLLTVAIGARRLLSNR